MTNKKKWQINDRKKMTDKWQISRRTGKLEGNCVFWNFRLSVTMSIYGAFYFQTGVIQDERKTFKNLDFYMWASDPLFAIVRPLIESSIGNTFWAFWAFWAFASICCNNVPGQWTNIFKHHCPRPQALNTKPLLVLDQSTAVLLAFFFKTRPDTQLP